MLLAELVKLSERMEQEKATLEDAQTVPSGYQMQAIKAFISLDLDGNFIEVNFTSGQKGKKDLGQSYAVPHVMRSSGTRAKLLSDNGEYVLGYPKKEGDPKVVERHQAFVQTLQACFEATQNPHVEAILKYLRAFSLEDLKPHLTDAYLPDMNVSFEVGGIRPFELPEIQQFWKTRVMGGSTDTPDAHDDPSGLQSLISGKTGTIMEREPVKIKGIPDGQTSGMNFISANAGAFESYGLEASQIAPVLVQEAEQYANALNALLKDPNTCLRLGGMVYVFWTREGTTPPVGLMLSQPSDALGEGFFDAFLTEDVTFKATSRPEQIRDALKGVFSDGQKNLDLEKTDFFAVGLSASGSRVVVRHHIKTSVAALLGTLGYYYAAQHVVSGWSGQGEIHGIYSLIASMYRDARKEMTRFDADHLLAFAFSKEPLPYTFLQRAVQRNRAEKRVTHPRAALLKTTLISRGRLNMGELEQLDTTFADPAYHLGRLLAVLDDIQGAVMRANATLVDRYYGSLSTTPASVLGRLLQGTQHHLARLRKDKPGVYNLKQRQLEEVLQHLKPGTIPRVMTLEGQSLFGLGYYHQKAQISQAIQEKSAQKKAQNPQNPLFDEKESNDE
ncbi:type I-C CRISPR-associated protein Cas8c/Csd1 [Deinococcus cellulosilyticus]|uniref:CRISPR-associated Csd1 family protein n=1 Tax=Deinococcus cellulosilyticus (strain DSM 18568 / NBRC 106333 / KACC 11606 / 5516J-15) TaxID=1223518 RepID=A0A511N0D3_DEIC1|nr:type I-C CRISPR-associated protein Cas8c/Csd1 [Deinococcus cellulosilyticus]GEM46312.1 CRISPR-associated Csd1 family protein [Deinococcus cellulosilyticus NBRC 106333 = KACC 11606]